MNKHDKIAAKTNLIKLPPNSEEFFEFDIKTDWVRDFLIEMNENATEKSPEEYLQETSLFISGELIKKNKPEMGEYLLVKGEISSVYATECVRTLKPMTMELNIPFKVCFIDESYATSELFKDSDETYIDNDLYELYFYKKRIVDLDEMLHEQIFLNYEQYPILDAESKIPGVEPHK